METGKRPQTKEQRQKQVITKLKNRVKVLEQIIKDRDSRITDLEEKLEKALLHIEQLQQIVFRGRKKPIEKGSDDDNEDDKKNNTPNKGHGTRHSSSYRRPLPKTDGVIETREYQLDRCPDCDSVLTRKKVLEFFVEDILPIIEWYKKLKVLIKQQITVGYCPQCQKRFSAIPIPKQKVSLGENIRQLIVFQTTIQQLSYSQIIDFSQSCLHLNLSQGEIVNILEQQSKLLIPAFEDLKQDLRSSPAHFDETGWLTIKSQLGDFAWTMASAINTNVCYLFGKSRGQGNVYELAGKDFNHIGITDGYGAYKNVFQLGKHALCWAHPYRTLKDLKKSKHLTKDKQQACQNTYQEFSNLYEEVKKIHALPFDQDQRLLAKTKLIKLFEELTKPQTDDPTKLKTIKETLRANKDKYFVCLINPNIPMDNNRAERSLRHLVIKRKKSFGSKTQKGADIMSIIYSVVMSLWNRGKETFFANYQEALKQKTINFA